MGLQNKAKQKYPKKASPGIPENLWGQFFSMWEQPWDAVSLMSSNPEKLQTHPWPNCIETPLKGWESDQIKRITCLPASRHTCMHLRIISNFNLLWLTPTIHPLLLASCSTCSYLLCSSTSHQEQSNSLPWRTHSRCAGERSPKALPSAKRQRLCPAPLISFHHAYHSLCTTFSSTIQSTPEHMTCFFTLLAVPLLFLLWESTRSSILVLIRNKLYV